MSHTLVIARQGLKQVQSQVKQGNAVAGVQALQVGLAAMRENLMSSERKEFTELVSNAVEFLKGDPLVKQLFPESLNYTPGKEADLNESLKELQKRFMEHMQEQAEEARRLTEEKKQASFERGKAELLSGNIAKGKSTFAILKREFPQDEMLIGDMGEVLLSVKMYEEAVEFFTEALDLRDDMVSVYNSIGIALRELKRFDVGETYYLRASQYLRTDPNLYFNIARLYLDWGKFPKAIQSANVALKLNPDFVEAQKLLKYVEKLTAAKGKS